MEKFIIFGILAVIFLSSLTFGFIGKKNAGFQKNCKVGDSCWFYDGEERLKGVIIEDQDDWVRIRSLEDAKLHDRIKKDIYWI